MSTIISLTSLADLTRTLEAAKDKLVVIDFNATWCGPCHAIAPRYEAFSKKYTNVVFAQCDVDKAQPVAQKYSVSAMPTFIFLKKSSQIDMVRGADPNGLEAAIKRHMGSGSGANAFGGKGQTLGGKTVAPEAPGGLPAMDFSGVLGADPQTRILLFLVGLYVGYLLFFS